MVVSSLRDKSLDIDKSPGSKFTIDVIFDDANKLLTRSSERDEEPTFIVDSLAADNVVLLLVTLETPPNAAILR